MYLLNFFKKLCIPLSLSHFFNAIHMTRRNLKNRYKGITITSKERSKLRTILKRKDIEVYSDNDYDMGWVICFNKCIKMKYDVNSAEETITFGTAKLLKDANKYKLNAILFELEKAAIRSDIAADRVEKLTETILSSYTAAQLSEFITLAAESKATSCAAVLLDYKNKNFGEDKFMDEFVLEW